MEVLILAIGRGPEGCLFVGQGARWIIAPRFVCLQGRAVRGETTVCMDGRQGWAEDSMAFVLAPWVPAALAA